MLRNMLAGRRIGELPAFRWRGTDVSRMEGFSDGVFGFALTLLVVSLDVPDNYSELVAAMRNTPSFAVCFLLLIAVWFSHYQFFRRYGLEDARTMAINAALLFVVLVYIYPLKFLFTELTDLVLDISNTVAQPDGSQVASIADNQWPGLLMIYAAGFFAMNLCFVLLLLNAWSKRAELQLTPYEELETRASILDQGSNMAVAVVAFMLAAFGYSALSGLSFALKWPAGWLNNRIIDRQRQALAEQTVPGASAGAAAPPQNT